MIKRIHGIYIKKACSAGIKEPTPGSISFTQRWGSALNLNPHMHVLCLDGVYALVQGKAHFLRLRPITDEETAILITQVSQDVISYLRKRAYLKRGVSFRTRIQTRSSKTASL